MKVACGQMGNIYAPDVFLSRDLPQESASYQCQLGTSVQKTREA